VLRVTGPRDRELVQDVRKKYHIERLIGEGMCDPSNISTGCECGRGAAHRCQDGEIGPPGLKNSGDKAIAAADVEHAGGGGASWANHPAMVSTRRLKTSLLVQDSDALMEYAVYNGTRVRKRGKRAIYVPCVARNATLWRASLLRRFWFSQKTRALRMTIDRMTMKLIQSRSEIRGTKRTESRREITAAVHHANELELLGLEGADVDDHASAFAELRSRVGETLRGSGDKDASKGA